MTDEAACHVGQTDDGDKGRLDDDPEWVKDA